MIRAFLSLEIIRLISVFIINSKWIVIKNLSQKSRVKQKELTLIEYSQLVLRLQLIKCFACRFHIKIEQLLSYFAL